MLATQGTVYLYCNDIGASNHINATPVSKQLHLTMLISFNAMIPLTKGDESPINYVCIIPFELSNIAKIKYPLHSLM